MMDLKTHLYQKKTKVQIKFLVGNQREYIILNLSHYIQLFYIV